MADYDLMPAVAEVHIGDGWEEYCRFKIADLRPTFNFPRKPDWRLATGGAPLPSAWLPSDRLTFTFCGVEERKDGHVAVYRYTPPAEVPDG
jgi:hypothetical protein